KARRVCSRSMPAPVSVMAEALQPLGDLVQLAGRQCAVIRCQLALPRTEIRCQPVVQIAVAVARTAAQQRTRANIGKIRRAASLADAGNPVAIAAMVGKGLRCVTVA